jgi:hypothetical protein
MRAMTSAAGSLTRTGYDVLLDFSIPPAFLPAAQKILRDAPLHYIVLRPPLEGKITKYDGGFSRCLLRRSGTSFRTRATVQRQSPRSFSRG